MKILDGRKLSNTIKEEIKKEVSKRVLDKKKQPHLAAVMVGNDGASLTYVGSKVRSCEQIGFTSTLIHLKITTTEEELLVQIDELNKNQNIDGYIVQLPLPKHISEERILEVRGFKN